MKASDKVHPTLTVKRLLLVAMSVQKYSNQDLKNITETSIIVLVSSQQCLDDKEDILGWHLPAFLPNSPSSSACVPVRGRSTISIVTTSDSASSLIHMTRPGKRRALFFLNNHWFPSTHSASVCRPVLMLAVNYDVKHPPPPLWLWKELH